MKILHIAECAGGVDRYLRMLLPRLEAVGIAQVFVCSQNFRAEDYRAMVDEVVQADMRQSLSPCVVARTVRKLRRIIRQQRPDIVYCHSSFGGAFGRLACLGLGVKVVYNPHGWAFDMKCGWLKRAVFRYVEWLLAKCTDKIVTISSAEKMSALSRGICKADKMQVIFNGIEFESSPLTPFHDERGMACRKSLGIPEDAYIVGMVGRISPQKAPDVFVRAGAEIIKAIPEAWLMIVGDGDDHDELLSLAKDLGVTDRLTITGWVDNADEYTTLFDQAMLLSRWEGFGLVLPEYAKAHKPIVATEVGAIGDIIIDKMNGRLVSPDNPHEAAQAVIDIYRNKDMRQQMIEYGYDRARICFDVERVAVEHNTLFDKVLTNVIGGGGKSRFAESRTNGRRPKEKQIKNEELRIALRASLTPYIYNKEERRAA